MSLEQLRFQDVRVRKSISLPGPEGLSAGDVVEVTFGERIGQNGLIIWRTRNSSTIQFEDGQHAEFYHNEYRALPPLPRFGAKLRDALKGVGFLER